ncbi:primosomal protein N' [Alphaproteobacteria bacterium]|nr:primosomal protein N' [Alphaproteobacteria bacterium]
MYYFKVIPFGLIDSPLLYKSNILIKNGNLVEISLRKKNVLGVILSEITPSEIIFDKKKILTVSKLLPNIFKPSHMEFIKYLSRHYFIELGMSFKISIGSQSNLQKKLKNYLFFKDKIYENKKKLMQANKISNKNFLYLQKNNTIVETELNFLFNHKNDTIQLNDEQEKIFKEISKDNLSSYSCHLIDGVTGSGKTELYYKFIFKALIEKKQVLVLLPEITLTEDWSERFYKYFGCRPYIWHSKQTINQKSRILKSLLMGEPCVVVGARSSVLLPFHNLKLIICDEEHDSSYKQDDGPKYHARDMAILKASKERAMCILVSASPSLETLYNVKKNKIKLHTISAQFFKTSLPIIQLIDMNKSKPSSTSWISKYMFEKTNQVLQNEGQVLFFLNRRGYAPTKMCAQCHATVQCKNCSINLVYHKSLNKLICHHCTSVYESNEICLQCSSSKFVSLGIGLERLQEEVLRLFSGKKVQIFSSDTLRNKNNKKLFFDEVRHNKTKILIGSQIIGKSFHFPNLKLVNIIDGDTTLHSPDFRALEKTYQLFQQVAGRSGREGAQGSVLIQTYNVKHPLFQSLIDQDRNLFIEKELDRREKSSLPPYFKIGVLNIFHKNQSDLRDITLEILQKSKTLSMHIYGPTPALIPFKKSHYHQIFFFKEKSYNELEWKISRLKSAINPKNQRFISIDIDPISIS